MLPPLRRWIIVSILAIFFLFIAFRSIADVNRHIAHHKIGLRPIEPVHRPDVPRTKVRWRDVVQNHPVESFIALPTGNPSKIPKIQFSFGPERLEYAVERKKRIKAVEDAFLHSWEGYKENAWLDDEVSPLTGNPKSTFGDWAATLVDSLDTLWIMGLKTEFEAAVSALQKINFTSTTLVKINVFETTIRFLGGLLGAYDVSGQRYPILLQRATELGDMLYFAFDTPNRLPLTHWDWEHTSLGNTQQAQKHSLLAEVGSLTLEFTRLSQLTGIPKYYDAVARVTEYFEKSQNETLLPGMWPLDLDTETPDFTKAKVFSIGGMGDSVYEYLPKQHILLGGRSSQYVDMYLAALATMEEHIFFRPLNPDNRLLLIPGTVKKFSIGGSKLEPRAEHLSCFAGGMVALAAKIFNREDDLRTARELVDGCIWTYQSTATGIGGEVMSTIPCDVPTNKNCTWSDKIWYKYTYEKHRGRMYSEHDVEDARDIIANKRLPPGFTKIDDARYILRPEAIESVFILYRITGDESLRQTAWEMFQAINNATRTPIAHAALWDVTDLEPRRKYMDSMESFWTAETLKYFYLIFSEPEKISLDDFVFNTEAHPLRRTSS